MQKLYFACLLAFGVSFVGYAQVTLPIDFEDPDQTITFEGFEGADSAIETNPDQTGENTSTRVMRTTKTEGSAFFAGTLIQLDAPIDFSTNKGISISSWSPKAGIPVRLRLENADNSAGIELDVNTTVASSWETLTYDLETRIAANPGVDFVRVVVFFEFINGTPGDGSTYYFDNIATADVSGGIDVGLPIDFENEEIDYDISGFEGANASIITNPDQSGENTSSRVVQTVKTDGAAFFAGTTLSLDIPVDFSVNKGISISSWSPKADIPVKIRLEDANNTAGIELDVTTTVANSWETLTADFTNLINPAVDYIRVIVFYEFVVDLPGDGSTYYFDNVAVADVSGNTPTVVLPVDFELTDVTYNLTAFEGAVSAVETNPDQSGENTSATVVRTTKTDGAQFFAGTTLQLDAAIDFSENTGISISSWSPKADIPVRIQLEGAGLGAIFVDVNTTVASTWETLTADFTDLIIPGAAYTRVTIFYEFVVDLPGDGSTYYYDNIALADVGDDTPPVTLPVDFESTELMYNLVGFAGAESAIETNPDQSGENTSATVVRTTKPDGSIFFAGTFLDLDEPIDFSELTGISISSWSPKAGIPVRIQLEGGEGIPFLAVDVMTTVANSWETLTADFTDLVNLEADYNRVTVIFDFVVDQPGDGSTYYYDNIALADVGDDTPPVTLPVDFESTELMYNLVGFEGAESAIETNPDQSGENTSATVVRTTKTEGSIFFAGTFLDLDEPIDFSTDNGISISSWSPKAGIPVRIQIEAGEGIPAQAVDVMTTVASSWETLTADFTDLIDPEVDYNRVTVIFDFVVDQPGDGSTYYYDNIEAIEIMDDSPAVVLPIGFEDQNLTYDFVAFEGAESTIIPNPDPTGANPTATVMQTIKTEGAQFFAGTAIEVDEPIDLSNTGVFLFSSWSPKAGIPVRVRLENAGNTAGIELDVNTTVASAWETLQVDFSTVQDPNVDYVRVVIFYEFVADLPGDGTTYYFDNLSVDELNSTVQLTAEDVQVFPNPTADRWRINSPEAQIETVRLFDLSGRLVLSATPRANWFEIDAYALPTGTYVLSVYTAEGRRTARLVKQ